MKSSQASRETNALVLTLTAMQGAGGGDRRGQGLRTMPGHRPPHANLRISECRQGAGAPPTFFSCTFPTWTHASQRRASGPEKLGSKRSLPSPAV